MHKIMLVLSALILTACSSVTPTPVNSGIEGEVFIGPICPVVRAEQECPDQPYQAVITVNSPKGEKIVQVQTDEQGHFKIPLPAGTYILHPESPSTLPFASEQAVIVEDGKFTQVTINYDSGIR